MSTTVWEECSVRLQNELPAQQYNTWIRPLIAETAEDNVLCLLAPNRFVLDWVNDKFLSRIHEIVAQMCDGNRRFAIEIKVAPRQTTIFRRSMNSQGTQSFTRSDSLPDTRAALNVSNISESSADNVPSQSSENQTLAASSSVPAVNDELENALDNDPGNSVDVENNYQGGYKAQPSSLSNDSHNGNGYREFGVPSPEVRVSKQDIEGGLQHRGNLNQHFTFKSFVEGKSNQLGLAAAKQIAENPGGAYNPLFIYGGVGLGKTHLMHAVGNALNVKKPNAKIVYLHSERFVADMVKALQLNAINDFKRYYRSVDALLIDDIQFFAGKERSQEEFFHTFNALLEGGQQIILTCDRYPKEISGLEERLKSRFGWGLTVAVEPPELETRVAILKKKAEQANMELPNDAAFFIAQRIRSNVREIEGALKRVIANAHFIGREITVDLVKDALKDLLALQDRLVSIDNIQRVVAEYYKIKVSDLHSKRRSRSVARPRQVAMYLSKDLTNHSLPEIGDSFGGRDHTTVLHACRKIKDLIESDSDIREDVKNLLRTLTT